MWDLTCEAAGTSRLDAYNTLIAGYNSDSQTNTDNTHTRVVLYVSGIGICAIAVFIAIIAFWFINKSPAYAVKATGVSTLIHFVLD